MAKKTIFLAGGCFWGTEHFMSLVEGVTDTTVGYANSIVPNPTYKQVCTGLTNAAETVKVDYDPDIVTLAQLLKLFFMTIDPTSVNRQGEDVGTQYRTGIFYSDPADIPAIKESLTHLQQDYSRPLAIELLPIANFYPAEDYHQDYLDKNPDGYCHISPELMSYVASLKAVSSPEISDKVSPL